MEMNTVPERAFGWDDEISNDSRDFVLLPGGDYPFTVTKMERQRFAGSEKLPACNMAVLTLRVNGGERGEAFVTHRLYLHSKCEGLLCAFFESIGLRKHGEPLRMPWDKVVGCAGTCRLEVHDFTGRDGEEHQSNQVNRFLPPKEEPAAPAQGWQQWSF